MKMNATSRAVLKSAALALTGNSLAQSFLAANLRLTFSLMGLGSGASAASSGEAAVVHMIRRLRPSPLTIFDVGANKGDFLVIVADCLKGSRFSVHCFEPGQTAFELLKQRAAEMPNVTTNNLGVSKAEGKAVLHSDVPGAGGASLSARRVEHFGRVFSHAEEVNLTTIDSYCEARSISSIDLLKLDIEGHELDALAGAAAMLKRRAISAVLFEFGGCNIDTRTYFQDFWYLFKEYDMAISRVTPSGFLVPIAHYDEIHEHFRTTNFVATTR